MKTLQFLVSLLLLIPVDSAFSQDPAQSPDSSQVSEQVLLGSWTISQITYITREGAKKMTQSQMEAQKVFADYYFLEGGKFKQITNMNDAGSVATRLGTWRLDGDKLYIKIKIDNRMNEMEWSASYKYETLNLSRTSPDTALKIINSFRKK
jgi:hypothetical protein